MAAVEIQIVHNYIVTEIKQYDENFSDKRWNDRSDYNTCFHCDAPFKNGDQLFIGKIKQMDNAARFFCETCNGIITREMEQSVS